MTAQNLPGRRRARTGQAGAPPDACNGTRGAARHIPAPRYTPWMAMLVACAMSVLWLLALGIAAGLRWVF